LTRGDKNADIGSANSWQPYVVSARVTLRLAAGQILSTLWLVIAFLRFLSVANVAIWFGSALFTVIALPAVFTGESGRILTSKWAGFAAEAILSRYYLIQYCCATIALLHLAAERLYLGRSCRRSTAGLLIGITSLVLLGGLVAQPHLHTLYRTRYWWGQTVEAQTQAARSFGIWHGVSQVANLLVVFGLVVYLWRIVRSAENSRFADSAKIRA